MNTKHLIMLTLVTFVSLPMVAIGQSGPNPSDAPDATAAAVNLFNLQESDIGNQPAEWWTNIRQEHLSLLRSGEEAERRQVLLNVIFLANYHREAIDFGRQLMPLYYTYRFDDDESMRILALVALRTIGDDAIMRNLAQDLRREKSDRVRRLTTAAVAEYMANDHRN